MRDQQQIGWVNYFFKLSEYQVEGGTEASSIEDGQKKITKTLGSCYHQEDDDDMMGYMAIL